MAERELTREEKAAIRKLVTRLCANYDREYGCLPLGGPCYMMDKCWTGAYCRYFREAVLPNNPVLEAALTSNGPAPDTKACPVCGGAVLPDGRTRYCSAACAHAARLKSSGAICGNTGGNVLAFALKKPLVSRLSGPENTGVICYPIRPRKGPNTANISEGGHIGKERWL